MARPGQNDAQREEAEAVGLAALVFIAEDGDRLGRFLNDCGLAPDELRQRAAEPQMWAAVLDYVMQDESLLLVFAAEKGFTPESIGPARAHLPGGDDGAAQQFAATHYASGATAARTTSSKRPSKRWAGPGS